MAYFLENIFQSKKLALVDFQYTASYRDTQELTERRSRINPSTGEITHDGESVVNVYEKDPIYINWEILCNPDILSKIWIVREGFKIPSLRGFYIGDGKYDKEKFIEWKNNLSDNEKSHLVGYINRFQEQFGIPPFWMNFFENFLIKGVYRYPEFVDKSKLNTDIENNYENIGMPGMGYINEEYEDNFYKPPISNSSPINRSRYSLFSNGDGSYSMTVFSGITRKKDFENAYAEIEKMGFNRHSPKKSFHSLELLALFIQKYFSKDKQFTKDFIQEYEKVFQKGKSEIDKEDGQLNRIKKNLKGFVSEYKDWFEQNR